MSKRDIREDYGVLDVIAVLSSKGESGRLQIAVGSSRGALFFKEGRLVDARVGTLVGFAAVNFAVSIGACCLNFDSSIPPPPSRFTAASERVLLKQRFGIDTLDAETLPVQPSAAESTRTPLVPSPKESLDKAHVPAARENASLKDEHALQATTPLKDSLPAPKDAPAQLKSATVARKAETEGEPHLDKPAGKVSTLVVSRSLWMVATKRLESLTVDLQRRLGSSAQSLKREIASAAQFLLVRTQSATFALHKKTAIRAGVIVLITIPAAVGITSYWSNGKETAPLETAPQRETRALPTRAVVPSSTLRDDKSVTIQPITKAMTPEPKRSIPEAKPRIQSADPELRATEAPATDTVKPISSETLAVRPPEKKESELPEEKAIGQEQKQLPQSAPRRIAVVIRVEDGRVSEAYVMNRRPGLEGHEATALRLARQRRYPKETSTTETVIFQVKGQH